jgi:DNA polymerase-3 subunit gamma/tau
MQTDGAAQPLIVRHRPATFDGVWGHKAIVDALQRRITGDGRPHAYLFTGKSGVGKTTLARIIAHTLNSEILEIDAASNNGVDAMRALVDIGYYMSPGAGSRMIILDECHMLSRSAWNAALKVLEEPPSHLYLALCTTELYRVPETVVTRSYHVKLDRLSDLDIEDYLIDILIKEEWDVDKDVFRLVVKEAEGSPRLALALLQECYDAPNEAEAKRIIATAGSSAPLLQIIDLVMRGDGNWKEHIQPLLGQIPDDDFSEAGITGACRRIIGWIRNAETENQARRYWSFLAYLTYPAHSYDPKSLFYTALGRMLWSNE